MISAISRPLSSRRDGGGALKTEHEGALRSLCARLTNQTREEFDRSLACDFIPSAVKERVRSMSEEELRAALLDASRAVSDPKKEDVGALLALYITLLCSTALATATLGAVTVAHIGPAMQFVLQNWVSQVGFESPACMPMCHL